MIFGSTCITINEGTPPMSLGNFALIGVLVVGVLYVLAMIVGMIAVGPAGLIGLAVIVFFGIILAGVVLQRAADPEDRHYSKTIKD